MKLTAISPKKVVQIKWEFTQFGCAHVNGNALTITQAKPIGKGNYFYGLFYTYIKNVFISFVFPDNECLMLFRE